LLESLQPYSGQDVTALVVQQPNFFGNLEEIDRLTDWAHQNKILVIAVVNPTSLALLKAPGQWGAQIDGIHGADIVCGEGQPLGVPLAAGGLTSDSWRHACSTCGKCRADRRAHRGRRRPSGVQPDSAGARAAYPPQQGDLEYMHQPGLMVTRRPFTCRSWAPQV